ncbi:hypothetical protein FQA39_LY11183 [Lamprigera yunnana]|nr:hypothetical protein FQA39_LY11183 [Lamprigera yunnana]
MMENEENLPPKNIKYVILNKNTVHTPTHQADLSRKLLCIEYPGIVDNLENMLESLGGLQSIEMAAGNYNRRLELKFRADDIFSKPTWGDKDYKCGLLVKITAHKTKSNEPSGSSGNEQDQNVFKYEAVAVVPMTFKFTRLCDFQYLPLLPKDGSENENPDTICRNIYKDIIPTDLPDMKWFESEQSKLMPFFFPPPVFAKFNSSKDNKLFYERYKYYEKVLPEVAERLKKESDKKQEPKNIISSRLRLFRKANSIFINFNAKDIVIPEKPSEAALNDLQRRGLLSDSGPLERLRKFFEGRPIWSKSALLHQSGIRNDRLKILLPAVAYYCLNGPWRIMWCKYGYDPTKDPNSRIYQSFDFRVRARGGLKVKVQAKRSYSSNILHYKAGPLTSAKFSLKNCTAGNTVTKPVIDERFYILKPSMLPPARQMFYQYCDLHLPEIQDMISRLPKITIGLKYHSKNGWLPSAFHEQCREIANKYVSENVKSLLLEEKRKGDEITKDYSSIQDKYPRPTPKPDVTVLGATIVIDSDDESKTSVTKKPDNDVYSEEEGGDDEDDGDDLTDSDEDGRDDTDDIDLEAVDEINQIIGNDSVQEVQAQDERESGSDEDFDPDLIDLYKKLILSNNNGNS